MTPSPGELSRSVLVRTLHHIESARAATPISTFCENFTIVPTFIVSSLTSAPAAVTDAGGVERPAHPRTSHDIRNAGQPRRPTA